MESYKVEEERHTKIKWAQLFSCLWRHPHHWGNHPIQRTQNISKKENPKVNENQSKDLALDFKGSETSIGKSSATMLIWLRNV
jgi:hypothetical protein